MGSAMTEFQGAMSASRPYVYPIDKESRDDVLIVDRLTKEELRLKHRLYLQTDWESNTVANAVMETALRVMYAQIMNMGVHVLDDDMDNTLIFYDLIEIAASNKKNESAEKTGNINVIFTPGERVKDIISDDTPINERKIEYCDFRKVYTIPDDEALTNVMHRIDTIARKLLLEKYSLALSADWSAIATAYIFLENMYRQLIMKLNASDKKMVIINFNDLIEFYAQKNSNGEAQVFTRPGMGAKLIIKSDATTEADED